MTTLTDFPRSLPAAEELNGKRIGIFGLSANPPTCAHRNIVAHIRSLHIFDELWILPVYHHIYDSKRNLEAYEHRIAMCEMSLIDSDPANAKNTLVRISRLEKVVCELQLSQNDGKMRTRVGTVDILEYVMAVYPGMEWNLVLGTDTYSDILGGKWKRAEDILKQANLHVFCRQNPSDMKLINAPEYARVSLYQIPGLIEVSSTNIRNRCPPIIFGSFASLFSETAYARDILHSKYLDYVTEDDLHPGVLAYIKAKQLYFMSPESLIFRRRWFMLILANIATAIVYSRKN